MLLLGIVSLGCGAAPPARPAASLPDSFLSLEHRSSMGSSFVLVAAHATLDGEELGTLEVEVPAEGDVTGITTPVCLGRRPVAAGMHHLALELTYTGRGYGVFEYLRGYRFSSHGELDVEVPEDASGVAVVSIGFENGSIATPVEDRPAIRWETEVVHGESHAGCTP